MELRHLRYFVAVAEEEHVTRAARRLGMQQPPLTQQIQALEAELGVPLFERRPRSIQLNEAGRAFLEDARRLLQDADAAVSRIQRYAQAADAVLRIGMTTTSALHHRTRALLRAFRGQRPEVVLQLEEGAAADLLGGLERGEHDVVLIRGPGPEVSTFATQWLSEDDLMVAVPAQHPIAHSDGIDLGDLRHEDLILYRQGGYMGLSSRLMATFERQGIQPRVGAEARRLLSAVNMVATGMGITVVPRSLEALRIDSVIYLPLQTQPVDRAPVTMIYRRTDCHPLLHEFLDVGERVARSIGPARDVPLEA
ncbi:hypothetical protein CAL29_01525 [Bordetella genomosp. 10]|uniref:HTH lysR-type domain-containing protein n=1 Tax=Bordetella genomosp. 10 TaxID=1416804 RepID=A0A261SJG3_9BORD|nr:LysR substrate-binding domain-containing protein [Bordetella genomosp. 10]OZI37137.1 hypothetical protein CAL29_01525 [Bordetella genomosp. 10]